MHRPPCLLLLFALATGSAIAQEQEAIQTDVETAWEDSLEQIVVTATRSARALEDVPVPTTVVTSEEIAARGMLRLSDVLEEQAGLLVVNDFGSGLQMQGFDPDYTLILIDGEPVVGRTSGTLDVDRLGVTGVERVEVVRGPLSSRYGADALAGVVNLITRRPGSRTRGQISAQLESTSRNDLSLWAETGTDRWSGRISLNRYGSNGHSLKPNSEILTLPEFSDYSAEARLRGRPTESTDLGLRLRFATQDQTSTFTLNDGSGQALYDETSQRTDWLVNPTIRQRLSSSLLLDASLYGTRFSNESVAAAREGGDVYTETNFTHDYGKGEAGLTWTARNDLIVHAGGGVVLERVGGERYLEAKHSNQPYGYTEVEFMPNKRVDLIASARIDAPSDYATRVTPRISALYRPIEGIRLRASVGSGYKAPDFRQRYLSFINAAVGYAVFGSEEVRQELARLEEAGGIEEVLIDPSTFETLRAESSTAYGLGVEWETGVGLVLSVDGFWNEVRDLVDTQPVARRTNGQHVFSYFNLDRVFTRGIEAELAWEALSAASPIGGLHVELGYQYLDSGDRDVLDAIDGGTVFARNENGRDVRLSRSDYGGLFGRSRHSGTLLVQHTMPRWGLNTSLRTIVRSRYGFGDSDGNGVAFGDREFAPGYALVNLTLAKSIGRADIRAGVKNLFDHTDPERLPSETGRVFFVGGSFQF